MPGLLTKSDYQIVDILKKLHYILRVAYFANRIGWKSYWGSCNAVNTTDHRVTEQHKHKNTHFSLEDDVVPHDHQMGAADESIE